MTEKRNFYDWNFLLFIEFRLGLLVVIINDKIRLQKKKENLDSDFK